MGGVEAIRTVSTGTMLLFVAGQVGSVKMSAWPARHPARAGVIVCPHDCYTLSINPAGGWVNMRGGGVVVGGMGRRGADNPGKARYLVRI